MNTKGELNMTKTIKAAPEPNMMALLKLFIKLKKSFDWFRLRGEQFKTAARPIDENGNSI